MYISINGIEIKISEDTKQAFENHQDYCLMGQKWLIRNDPDGANEAELIEMVTESIILDYQNSLAELQKLGVSLDFESLEDAEIVTEEYWWQLQDELLNSKQSHTT